MHWVCYNGSFHPANAPLFPAVHPAVKYGDGVFETMRIWQGRILLLPLHMERLGTSLQLLQIQDGPDWNEIEKLVLALCEKNYCIESARVRVSVYRAKKTEWVIEAVGLPKEEFLLNTVGWKAGIFPFGRKTTDAYANIKSINYQLYILAGLYAEEQGWQEALVLNSTGRVADGSKTNVFVVHRGNIKTPALHQGCIDGVMRRYLLDELKKRGFNVYQQEVTEDDLLQADEVFCTNAIRGIRWVNSFKKKTYSSTTTADIHHNILSAIYR